MLWKDKRYHTLNYEMKKIFGEKTIKLSINGGFTCPNRDGTIGTKGCLFCSEKGSGEFAGNGQTSIKNQIKQQKDFLSKKWKTNSYIAYFQSYTNTYAPVEILKKKYYEALNCEGIKGLAIATRPDCINDETIKLLKEINKNYFLWVELGLQTIHHKTAEIIRRGYDLNVFEKTLNKLNNAGIKAVVHLIIGLPNETNEQILQSVNYISNKNIWGVKLHLMHVLKNTDLEEYYYNTNFKIFEKNEYVSLLCDCLEKLPPKIVIHRVTGDGKKSDLVTPRWSLDKLKVLSDIDKELKTRNSWQGKLVV